MKDGMKSYSTWNNEECVVVGTQDVVVVLHQNQLARVFVQGNIVDLSTLLYIKIASNSVVSLWSVTETWSGILLASNDAGYTIRIMRQRTAQGTDETLVYLVRHETSDEWTGGIA